MLRRLLSRVQRKVKRVLGFRLARDLNDCGKDIMTVFSVTDFYRDYEDTWEWVEGQSLEGLHVNISRPHNWKTGDYLAPVVVHVRGPASCLTDGWISDYALRCSFERRWLFGGAGFADSARFQQR